MLRFALLMVPFVIEPAAATFHAAQSSAELHVRREGAGEFSGDDDRPIQAALERLRGKGGTVVVGPGEYIVRRAIQVPAGSVLRGSQGTVLRMPSPSTCTESAAAGSKTLTLASVDGFVPDTWVQILPPAGAEFFADGKTPSLDLARIGAIQEKRLVLVDPLALDVPRGSRVGYAHKILQVAQTGNVVIENLTLDGGALKDLPMSGHHQRCGIWAAARFSYGEERLGPPGEKVFVRHCVFRNFYGRGVAFYHMVDSAVEGCHFENIYDEAIDFDHFCERNRAAGNEIRNALWGIVLNDASRCTIEFNRISNCGKGIFCWWYERTPQERINEENVIRHNVVRACSELPIHLAKACHRNTVEQNFVEGEILVEEPDNVVQRNTRL